ncbi:MAG: hypothetical protein NC827_05125 [Candidatus Omnitrophica bacterium]|nr:hypothetical protein [Candidatus Omnitrophota bacterium]
MFILNLVFLSLNSFLLAGVFNSQVLIEFFTIFLIFFYSQILGISIILGLLKILYPEYILIFLLVIFLFLMPKIKNLKLPKLKTLPLSISFLLSLTISLHLLYILNLLILPPLVTDGLLYHLPFAVHYYKTGSISLPNLYFTDISMTYYPIGGEIFYFFTLLSKKEFLLKFTQYPFLILACFSIFLICKSFGFSDFLSSLSAICFSLLKPVLKEASMCFVDLIMASTFISTLYFFKKSEKKYITIGLFSSALLISTKTLSLIFWILTLPFLFLKKTQKFSKFFYFSVSYLLFFGFFSYWRNLFLTGNPFYPAEISFGNLTIFAGSYIYSKTPFLEKLKLLLKILAFSHLHIDPSKTLKTILLSFYLISLFLSFKNKQLLIFYLTFPLSILLYLILIPTHYYQIRHFLPVYTVLSISLINPFFKFEVFFLSVFLYLLLYVFPSLFFLNFLIIFSFFVVPFILISYFKKPVFYFLFIFSIFLFIFFQIDLTEQIYQKTKFEFWKSFYSKEAEIWEYVQEKSGKGKNIAYIGSLFIYPLYGKNLENNLFYQSVNSVETLPVYKYRKKIKFPQQPVEDLYRQDSDFEKWISGIRDKKIEWVIIKNQEQIEKKWIEENPQIFKLLFSNKYIEIFEINKSLL